MLDPIFEAAERCGSGRQAAIPTLRPVSVRVAEFKLARWDGHDAMRKRQVFKDLVHLAADASGRRAELYVLGERPLRFLRETGSSAEWGLDRFPATRQLFRERFGSLAVPISAVTDGAASHVRIINLAERLPRLFGSL